MRKHTHRQYLHRHAFDNLKWGLNMARACAKQVTRIAQTRLVWFPQEQLQ